MNPYDGVSSLLESYQKVISLKFTLNSGTTMPILGYGTFLVHSKDIYGALDAALSCGYRNIDTAELYRNALAIGAALKKLLPKYGLKREDIFITFKLAPQDLCNILVEDAVDRALCCLESSYIDLFLIHWPGAQRIPAHDSMNPQIRADVWKELIRLHNGGKGVLRAIGVSNFLDKHIEQIVSSTGFPPAVNQVEFHPFYHHPKSMYEICEKHNILLQAYSSLGGFKNAVVLQNPVVQKCANKNNVTPAQVLLRWALQCGYAIIPKSVTPERIAVNAELDFKLDKEDMSNLCSIIKSHCEKFAWDPIHVN